MNRTKKQILVYLLTCAFLVVNASVSYAQDDLTDRQRARMKELHEEYPFLNRGQLMRAVRNPQAFERWIHNKGAKRRAWWDSLEPEQKEQFQNRMDRWQRLDPQQKKTMRERYKRFKDMDPQKRNALREKYHKWQNLSEDQKQHIRERRERFHQMSPEEKERIRQKRREWHNLPEEQKKKWRDTYHKDKEFRDQSNNGFRKHRGQRLKHQRDTHHRGSRRR